MTGSYDYVRNFGVGVSSSPILINTNLKNDIPQLVTNYYYDSEAQIDGVAS